MNFSRNNLLIISATLLFVLNACNKDDDQNLDSTPARTKLQLLTDHGWTLTKITEDGIDVTSAYFTPCELDNIFNYTTAYTYTIDEGPTKCDPSNPQIIESGTWAFGNNQNMLILNPGANEDEFSITQLDANTLKFQDVDYDSSLMQSTTYVLTFSKS